MDPAIPFFAAGPLTVFGDSVAGRLFGTFLLAYTVSTLLTAIYDAVATRTTASRSGTAPRRRAEVLAVYRQAAGLTLLNILVTIPVCALLLQPFIQPRPRFQYSELWLLPLLYVLSDACFYLSHRAFHTRRLFRSVHRIHHRLKAPVGFAALYAHPLEVFIGNMLPVILPPVIVGASMPMMQLWILLAIVNTVVISHSGISRVSVHHDLHHRAHKVNLGAELGLMDRLGGTYQR